MIIPCLYVHFVCYVKAFSSSTTEQQLKWLVTLEATQANSIRIVITDRHYYSTASVVANYDVSYLSRTVQMYTVSQQESRAAARNSAMLQVFFSVEVRQQHSLQV